MPSSFTQKLKQTLSRNLRRRFKEAVVGFQVGALLIMPVNSFAAEGLTGGAVVEGAASIQQAGSITNIHQTSQNAVINWNTFNIGAGETANFIQPNIDAGVLNNVTGGSLSSIAGQINATGSVTIVNPQGIVFHNGSLINAASITASTLNVSSQDFMNGGTLNFSGDSNASIINNGSITATDGNINLFAADVQNNGELMAPNGLINLGAGHNITLHENGTYTVTGANGSVQVLNSGIINGGAAMLTAGAGSSAVNSGVEKATVIVRQNGRVRLGTTDSVIEMAGGSMITATDGASPNVTMTGPTAEVVDASIDAAGGSVLVDSNIATTVVDTDVIADSTEILSDGAATGLNVSASGHLRLDPVDVTAGGITAGSISIDTATAGQGTNLGPGLGNITITGDLTATDGGTGNIELLANNDILIDAINLITNGGEVVITGDAGLVNLGGDPSNGAGAVFLDGTSVFTAGGDVEIAGVGHNDQGAAGLIGSGVGVTLSGATIDTRPGAVGGMPVDADAGGIEIRGAGNIESRMGAADVGGNIGVLITDASTLVGGGKPNAMNDVNNDIIVIGFGGGLPDGDILNAADPFADFAANYGSGNAGVVIDNASTIELVFDLTNPMGNDSSPVQQAPGFDDPELHIYGFGGNGLDQNAGILIDNGSSVTANDGDLIITGIAGGVPDSLAIQMIQNHLGQGASGDPVADFQSLYVGVQNTGVAIRNGSTVRLNFELPTINGENRRRFDDVNLNSEPVDDNDEFLVDPILLITGIGGTGQNENAGVVFDTTSVELASDAHVTITGIGGGVSGAAVEALIMNTDLNDGVNATDFIDVSNQDVIDAIGGALGADNAGVAIIGDGSVLSMGGSTAAGTNPNVVAGDGRPVGESTGRLTINGFGGLGKDTNYGVRVEGLGAGIAVESGDLYVNAYGGGTYIDSVLDSNFYGVGNEGVIFSPRNIDDEDADFLYPQLVQGFDTDWAGGIPDLNNGTADIRLNANPNATDFITRDASDMFVNAFANDRVFINNILERDLTADEIVTLGTLFGDDNHGLSVEGLGAFIEGTSQANLFLDGHGGVGRSNNHGVFLSGLGAYITAADGNNINQDLVPNVNDLYNINDQGSFDNNRSRNGIAGVNINGEGGGISSIIVQGMISNASKLEFVDPDNPQFVGVGDDFTDGAIAPAAVVDNEDLITAIFDDADGVYGGDNKGVFATGLGVTIAAGGSPQFDGTEVVTALGLAIGDPGLADAIEMADDATRAAALAEIDMITQTPATGATGNVAIVGEGGFGKSNNMGVHITGLGATVKTEGGNIDIFAYGGGIPDDVLAIDQASNGIVVNDTLHIKVDKLFERDMDGADLATLSVGPTAIYGSDNRGFLLEGLGAQVVSEYAEPSFVAGDATSAPIRDNNGYFLNGRYDANGNFIPVLPDGYDDAAITNNLDDKTVLDHLGDNNGSTSLTRHPDARHVQIVGVGGTGVDANTGVEINGLGVKVETDSADVHIEGEAGGVSTRVAQSLIENAKDTFFDVPGGTTDRTDLFYGGFENVDGIGIADIAEEDLTPGDDNPTVIGNGVHVAADTRDVIQALDALYGDSNEGVVVTGLGAKVHAKTGTPGMVIPPDTSAPITIPPGMVLTVDGTDYNPGDTISLDDLEAATTVSAAPDAPIDDGTGPGPIADAVADGDQAELDGDAAVAMGDAHEMAQEAAGEAIEMAADANTIEADTETAATAAAGNPTDPDDVPGAVADAQDEIDAGVADAETLVTDSVNDAGDVIDDGVDTALNGQDAGDAAIMDGLGAVADADAAIGDSIDDATAFTDALTMFLADVEAAQEPTVVPGADPATTAGNVFITGTGGYGESTNNGVRVDGLGAKVQADLGNIHIDGFGGGLPEGIFVIQGDGHVEGGFAGTFGPSEYETTVTAANRNYRTDRLFEVDFDVNDWDFLVAPAGPAPNGESSDGLYGDGNEGIIVTGLGAAVISDFTEPAALRAFYRAQDSVEGRTADFKFAHSYLTPGDGTAFENYNGYNDSQETGQGDAAWVGVDGNDNLLGNGIVGNLADDFQFLDSPVDPPQGEGVNMAGAFNVPNVTETVPNNSGNDTANQDNILGNVEVTAIGNSGTSLDVIAGGLSGTDATNKGELVLVDEGNFGVQAYTIARGDGELLGVDGVTQNLPTGVGGFLGTGDNFSDTTYKVGVNDNARLTTDGQGNLINTNQLVDGPGAGYQRGIAVLQKRDVELNGVGGFGRSDNLGVRIEGLGAKVTSTAASIDIEGSGGGIQSNVIRSAIENFADVTPVVLPNGVGTDRIADFSQDDFNLDPNVPIGPGAVLAGSDGIADLDQHLNGTQNRAPDGVVDDNAAGSNTLGNANALVIRYGNSQDLFNDMLEVRLTSDEIMGGTDAGGTQGLVNFYGDNNQGVLITGLGAKVEATLTANDVWAAINGDAESRNPLGTDGSELFNYTTGDPNYTELVASDGIYNIDHPLASTRELSLDALEDESFMMLTGNLNNSTITDTVNPDAVVPTFSGDGANFSDPARGALNADANIIGSIVDHQFANDADVATATITGADLTNESAAVTRAAIAEATDNIIVTARESRANVSITGHGGAGKGDNWGVHLLGLGVKAVAGTALTGGDAGNVVIDGIGGGIPSGLNGVYGIGDNVVAIDHPENFITDKLLEADFTGTALKDPVYGIPALYGDNNMGFELNGLGAKVESQFVEPFVAVGPINPEVNSAAGTIETALSINENTPDPLRSFIHREDDHTIANTDNNRAQLGLPVVASRDVQIIGDGGTGTNNNKGVFITGLGAKVESVSSDIFVLGNTRQTSGIPNAVVQSMIENASDVIWNIPGDNNEDNDRIADRNPVTNLDLMEAIAMTYGDDNRGVHVTGLGAKIESTDTDVSSFVSNFDNPAALDVSDHHFGVDDHNGLDNFGNNKGTGNIVITGNGGYGQSNNIGFEIAGLGVKVQSGVGNITITGEGGGVPAAVLAMDNNSIDGGARNYLVDKLFERDFSSTDLDAFYAGPTAIYGSNNAGIIVTGLGAKVQSDYIEPIAGSGTSVPSDQSLVNSIWRERHVRNINGNILTGDYTGGDTWTARLEAAPDITDPTANVGSEHPLSRRVSLIGDGGWGIDNNRGLEVSGLGAKVQSESADIALLGNTTRPINTYAIPDSVVVSIIENANDTTPIRDGDGNLLTDRTDGVFPGFVVGVEGTTARDVIFDTTGAGFINQTVITDDGTLAANGIASTDTTAIDHQGNSLRYSGGTFDGEGIHVAARNDSLINLLDAIYGDNNRGVYVTGLGAKVHSVNASFGGNVTVVGNGGRGEANNVGYEQNGLGTKTVAEHGNVWITGVGGGVPSEVLAIDHAGNGRADKLFEVDMDAADLALFAANIYDDNNRGVYVTGLGAKVESNFKEPAALRRFVDPESGEVKYAFAYNPAFGTNSGGMNGLHGEPKNFSDYGSPNDAQELHAGNWAAEDQASPRDLGYAGLDVRSGGFSGTDATDRGELVLVDPGNEDSIGAFLITDAYGEFQDVNGLTNASNFIVNGDNFSTTDGYLVGVNDNARVTTDAAGNIINNNLLVDGPGAGYQQGVAVVQTRDVVINGTGGRGKSNNMGFELNGLGAKVATLAADIDIHGVAGGIPSDVVRSIIENGADITPIAGTDRVADFSQDIEILDVTAFDGLNNDGGNTADATQPSEFNNGIMIGGSNFVADLDESIPVPDTNHVQGYVPGHDGVVDNPILTNPMASMGPASENVVNDTADDIPNDLRRQRVDSADLISTLDTLYGDNNKGVFATGLGVKIETNLTAETLAWRSTQGEGLNHLGTNGDERFFYTTGDPNGTPNLDGNGAIINDDNAAHDAISAIEEFSLNALEDETFASLHGNLNNNANIAGSVSDGNGNVTAMLTPDDLTNESAAVTRAAIAEAADTIIVTSRRSRADVTIIGEGGTGTSNNYGVQVTGLGATVAAKTSLAGGDAGNILIDGVGGGIPSDVANSSDFNGNVIAIDHPENGLTDKLLESDFLGSDFTALAALFGDNNMGFELSGLGAKVQSDFVEPYVAIAPINPSVNPNAGTLAGALNIDEHQPDPLRSYVYLEENAGANGIQYGLPITGSRDVQIIGDGGTGTNNNKGVFVTGLGAKVQSASADIWVLGNTRRTSGIPDAVVQSMIENASDVVWNIPGDGSGGIEDNDRIMDNQPVSNADLIAGITAIYGDNNRGVHVTGLGTKIVSTDTDVSAFSSNYDDPAKLDVSEAYTNVFGTNQNFGNRNGTGNITIEGNGGRGKGTNVGVEQTGLGTTIQSGVGNIKILAQGGGIPNEVLVIDGTEGAPLASRNYLVDKLFERDMNDADLALIPGIFGDGNEGFILSGLGAKVQSDYIETPAGSGSAGGGESSLVNSPWEENYIRDLDGNFLTGGYTLGHNDSAEMFTETGSNAGDFAVVGESPLARRVTIVGNAGTGINDNKGIRVQGLGAKVQSESADITLHGNETIFDAVDGNYLITDQGQAVVGSGNIGGMQDAVIRSLIENAKSPFTAGTDRTDGVVGDFIAQTVVNPAGDPLEGQPFQTEFLGLTDEFRANAPASTAIDTADNTRRYSGDDAYDGAGVFVAATNAALVTEIDELYGDENIGIQVQGLGAKVHSINPLFGGDIDMVGNGGRGQSENFGIKVQGLGAKIQADHGSIDMDGVAGGPPSEVFVINGNGRVDRLFEVDFDVTDVESLSGTLFDGSADNTGVRVQGLGAKVESNFKEPPALRAFTDPVTGYTKYAFAYSDPFEVAADFHGEPAGFDDYDSPNGSDQVNGGTGMMNNGRTDDTDRGTLVLTNGNTSDGRLLVPNTFGELEVGGQTFVLNDNVSIGGDTAVDGVPVVQMRTVDINGEGGNGQNTNYGVQIEGLGAKVTSTAADINIYGKAGGIPSDVVNSLIENIADVTPAAGRDRIADFDNDVMGMDFIADNDLNSDGIADDLNPMTSGAPDDLLQEAGGTSEDILAAMDVLYGTENKGVLIKGLGAKVQATLTPEQLPQHSADVAANLGTTGEERIFLAGGDPPLQDLPALSPGMLSGLTDEQRAQANRDIAEAADTILLTAQISRADVTIEGIGGTGKADNIGVHVMGLGAKVIADHATAGDAGNIDIDGLGGGIPMDVLQIGSNGLTDTLFETDLTPAIAAGGLNSLLFNNNHGVAIEGLGAGVESTFMEPFVASAVTSVANSAVVNDDLHGAVYTDAAGNPLVAFRTVTIDGEANATIDGVDHVGFGENKGVFVTGLGSHVESDSSNILINGQGGGVPDQLLHDFIINANDDPVAGTDRINDGVRDDNTDIIIGAFSFYGDQNKGIEFSGLGTRVESTDDRVSAPNSLVGNVSLVGHAGPGGSDNIGVEVNGLGAKVSSGVGNILVEGFGGGPSAPVVANSAGVIDSVNELQGLTAGELGILAGATADRNHGVYVAGLGAKVESLFDEPDVGDIPGKAYSYRGNDARNPFFINNMDLAKTDTTGFVRVLKTDLDGGPLGLQGNGILRDDLVAGIGKAGEGREVVIAGMGGTGQNQNKGVFFEGLGVQATSIDADVDIDGLAGGAPDSVIAILNADHPDGMVGGMFDTAIANLYGTENHGVEFLGAGSGSVITDEGTLEVNGTGGQGYADNKGILITGMNAWSVAQGDIVMVGKGGGVLETFNAEYDAAGNPGDRVENHGIEISGMSTVASNYETDEHDDLYETEAEEAADALLLLDGMVGNNMELGNDQVGEVRDITSPDYVNDLGLGGPADATTAQGDVGIIVEGTSTVSSIDADIDLYANLDLLVQGASTVETVGNGDLAAVATRHLEVSGASTLGHTSDGMKSDGTPNLVTLAWDQALPAFARDGRLKVDGSSSIDAGAGAGELRLYGNRRGPAVFDFGVNMEVDHPTGFSTPAFGNEIGAGATFNGVTWSGIYNVPPEQVDDHAAMPMIDTMNDSPAVATSGSDIDHNLEFCPWEQEQWGVAFDVANRRAVADSDRFGTTQAPSAYNFGNPGDYTGDVTFFYPGFSLHETFLAPADCTLLPFSCNMRERLGPMTYSEMLQSVFGDNGSIGYGEGWEGATGGTLGDGFSAFGSTPFNVTSPAGGPVRFDNLQSLIEYFEEAPAGSYGICGNGNDDDSAGCTTYEHDPDAEDWQEKLMDALEAETPPVPPVPPTAELDLEINISGL